MRGCDLERASSDLPLGPVPPESACGLGIQIQQTTGLWSKSDIEARTAALVDFVLGRWPLWIEG
jgi:hypothetical protein